MRGKVLEKPKEFPGHSLALQCLGVSSQIVYVHIMDIMICISQYKLRFLSLSTMHLDIYLMVRMVRL